MFTPEVRNQSTQGELHFTLAAGTAAATQVPITGLKVGDEFVSVLSFTTAASIATVADRTGEYQAPIAGNIPKPAGTNETSNQLLVIWRSRS